MLQRVRPFVQLDVCAPGIVNKRKRGPGLRILRVGSVQLDAGGLEFLAERFQVLDVEADVIEHSSLCGNRRHVRAGKNQICSGQVSGFVLSSHAGLGAEYLAVPGLNLRYLGFRYVEMNVMMLDRKFLVFVFQDLDPQFIRGNDKGLIRSATELQSVFS